MKNCNVSSFDPSSSHKHCVMWLFTKKCFCEFIKLCLQENSQVAHRSMILLFLLLNTVAKMCPRNVTLHAVAFLVGREVNTRGLMRFCLSHPSLFSHRLGTLIAMVFTSLPLIKQLHALWHHKGTFLLQRLVIKKQNHTTLTNKNNNTYLNSLRLITKTLLVYVACQMFIILNFLCHCWQLVF